MADWSLFDLKRELARQRGRTKMLLATVSEKILERELANARLLQRRQYYVPKNNGKGRPPKKLKSPLRKDLARRQQYAAESDLLKELFDYAPASVANALAWLNAAREKELAAAGVSPNYRLCKIHRLLGQFDTRKTPVRLGTAEGPRAWVEVDVRKVLAIQHHLQQAKIDAIERRPVCLLADQDVEDAERARLAVLERFLFSRHLDRASVFLSRAGLICQDVPVPAKAYDKAYYAKCWREGVDWLIDRLRLDFEVGP